MTAGLLACHAFHGKKYRVPPQGNPRFQAGACLREECSHRQPRAVSPGSSGIHPPAGKILGARGARINLAETVAEGARMEGAFREMVRGRKTQRVRKLS